MEVSTTKSGLLQRANSYLADVTPKFDEWVMKKGFKHAGIFNLCQSEKLSKEYYYLSEVFGLNTRTIASSVSLKEFWNGLLPKAFEWQCFSKDFKELNPFLELFDDSKSDDLSSLYFLPFKDKQNPLFLVVAEYSDEDTITLPPVEECLPLLKNIVDYQYDEAKKTREIEESIDKGLEISPAYLSILSLKTCIEKSLQNSDIERKLSKFDMVDRIEMKSHIIDSVTKTAHSIIEPLFQAPNCINLGTNGEIKLAMFAKDEPDEQIISFHIASTLSDLIGEDVTKQILLLSAGICPNKKGTISFLTKG